MFLKAKWISLVFICLVFFPFFVLGQSVFVSIQPSLEKDSFDLFSFEVFELELVVVNNLGRDLTDFEVTVSSAKELVLIVDGVEKKQQKFFFREIKNNGFESKKFFVKALFSSPQKSEVKAQSLFSDIFP